MSTSYLSRKRCNWTARSVETQGISSPYRDFVPARPTAVTKKLKIGAEGTESWQDPLPLYKMAKGKANTATGATTETREGHGHNSPLSPIEMLSKGEKKQHVVYQQVVMVYQQVVTSGISHGNKWSITSCA